MQVTVSKRGLTHFSHERHNQDELTPSSLDQGCTETYRKDEEDKEDDIFTLFPKLPVEIRLKIWRNAFARRQVRLFCFRLTHLNLECPMFNTTQPNPVTLFVNQESRAETRRHYGAVPSSPGQQNLSSFYHKASWDFSPEVIHQVLYLNPELDTVVLQMTHYLRWPRLYLTWLSRINSTIPGGLGKVQQLDLLDIWWPSDLHYALVEQIHTPYTDRNLTRHAKFIDLFSGLKKVCMRSIRNPDLEDYTLLPLPTIDESLVTCAGELGEWLRWNERDVTFSHNGVAEAVITKTNCMEV